MLSVEDNELLIRTGAGTPMGELFRRFWMPVLLSRELAEPDGPPVRVRVMGEDLVAFRDTSGRVGLVDARCAHRGADLWFGRNEDCGLRCVYHGWKFDAAGRCVDIPTMARDEGLRVAGRDHGLSDRGVGRPRLGVPRPARAAAAAAGARVLHAGAGPALRDEEAPAVQLGPGVRGRARHRPLLVPPHAAGDPRGAARDGAPTRSPTPCAG